MESLSPSSIRLLFCSSKSRGGLTQMHFKWAIYRVDIQPGIVPQNSSFILGHGHIKMGSKHYSLVWSGKLV